MEETSFSFDSNHIDDADSANSSTAAAANNNGGWQKVTYAKKQRKRPAKKPVSDGSALPAGNDGIFTSLEKQSEERRRRIAAHKSVEDDYNEDRRIRSANNRDDDVDDDDSDKVVAADGVVLEEKKPKLKKQKKPKVTISEAAAKINADDLATFLADVSASYVSQENTQMMRLADYFGRAFAAVSGSQFPWAKLFRESNIEKIVDNPVSHIPEPVYKTSVDWISQRSGEALGAFVLWSLDSILADLASQQPGGKGSKKSAQQTSSKSQVAIFSVLAMVLRRKPDVLTSVLPTLQADSKYKGQDKLPLIVWIIAQASQGELAVGLYSWAHLILPILGGKSGSNPQTRDLVLQLVERILSAPKSRTILINSAVRKGERLVPPSTLELLLQVTFPQSSARVKATERFESIYPILKEVALAGVPGSKAMKNVSVQTLTFAMKVAGEGIPELSKEAINISLWCLTQHPDSYKQWENIYVDNLEASVAVLKKLTKEWKQQYVKQSSIEVLGQTLKSFRHKNEKALADSSEISNQALFKDVDKYCKWLLGKLSNGHGCLKGLAFVVIALGMGVAILSPSMESLDWKELSALFSQHSF